MKIIIIGTTLLFFSLFSYSQKSAKYNFLAGDSLYKLKKFNEAMPYFTNAINLSMENTDVKFCSMFWLGDCKSQLEDWRGALKNLTEVIEMSKGTIVPVLIHKADLENEINRFVTTAFYIRGGCNHELNYDKDACTDWRKAEELGFKEATGVIKQYCK